MKRYIDADKLIEEIDNSTPMNWTDSDRELQEQFDYAVFKQIIESQPTADVVEVRHGKWRVETDEEMPHPMFKLLVCSSCGATANKLYNFCPHCGAKMDGERKDDGT